MSRRAVTVLTCVVTASLLVACSKSENKSKETSGLPAATDWKAPAPAASSGSAGVPRGNPTNPHAGLDLQNRNGAPAGADLPPPDPNRAIDPSKFLEGNLVLDAKVQSQVKGASVVYLSVKRADPKTGAPTGAALAVERLELQAFPAPFKLTEANAMTRGTGFSGDVVISAWTDQDKDASTKQPGDVLGSVRATIPAKGLSLVLDTIQQ